MLSGVSLGFFGSVVFGEVWRRLRLPSPAAAASDPPACGRVLSGVSLGFFGSVVFGEALAAFAVPGRYRVRPSREREGVVGGFVGFSDPLCFCEVLAAFALVVRGFVEFIRIRFRIGLN